MKPRVLLYGSPQQPGLHQVYQLLQARERVRATYLTQEQFPRSTRMLVTLGQELPPGFITDVDGVPIAFNEVNTFCVDTFYVARQAFEDVAEGEQGFAQAESWAALMSAFESLSAYCLVVNQLSRRDALASRYSELCTLAGAGFSVPRMLVTSNPEAARQFYQSLRGQVVLKPVGGRPPFRRMNEGDLERLDRIRLAPIHFEEITSGSTARLLVAGDNVLSLPEGVDIPSELAAKARSMCHGLQLWLAEVGVRPMDDGWQATGMRTFVSPETLAQPGVAGVVCPLLEEGLEAFAPAV